MNIANYLAKNPNISFVPSNISGNLLNLQVWLLNLSKLYLQLNHHLISMMDDIFGFRFFWLPEIFIISEPIFWIEVQRNRIIFKNVYTPVTTEPSKIFFIE